MREAVVTQESARHIRFKGRSFPVLTLEPEAPLDGWIEQLDGLLAQSPAFFARKSIVIDAAKLGLQEAGLAELVEKLTKRGIRMMGIAGVDMAWASDDLPPILSRGRALETTFEPADGCAAPEGENAAAPESLKSADAPEKESKAEKDAKAPMGRAVPLIVAEPVRSGQSIYYPEGDVTVVGSVASGAEILAGGSVHVYGTLRGRAMAGAYGEKKARVFCRKLEAELIAICGVYLTAEEIARDMQGQPIQAWLDNETVKIARLD